MNRKSKKAGIIFLAGVAISAVPFFLNVEEKARTDSYIESFMEGSNEDTGKHNKKKNTEKISSKETQTQGKIIAILEIPSLGLKYPVFEGTDTEQLREGIGHMAGTARVFGKGNCVLAGHNGSSRGIYFTNLCSISTGAEVKLTNSKKKTHTYKVAETKTVYPYDDSYVAGQTEDETLTLFTCAENGSKRFVVKCVR
ncbi:MAG: class D sortase [Lachnospiraceae bacterium]|nr:class D sortase [Lachnospiraceae bacterium]